MVSEMFLNSYRKIRKILKIKEEAENSYLQKLAQGEATGIPITDKDGKVKEDLDHVRRLATSLYQRNDSEAPPVMSDDSHPRNGDHI
jgi:hypothetical protein